MSQLPPNIFIIGAGISGLALSRCLAKGNLQSIVFEKASGTASRNTYGITLHPWSYRPLLKILELDETAFRRRVAVDGSAGRIAPGSSEDGSFRANRSKLELLLAEGLDVRWETEVTEVQVGTGGNASTTLALANGERMQAGIIVGADGPHSVVRQAVAPKQDFKILPFAVYNGKFRSKGPEFEEKFGEAFDSGNVLEHKTAHGELFQVSINEKTAEQVSLSYTYSRPARQGADDPLYRPERSKSAAREIPEDLYAEIARLRPDLPHPFDKVFDPDTLRERRHLNWLMRSLAITQADLDEAAKNGVVLIGDAVHAEPILGGEGANRAILDGTELTEFLAGHQHGDLSGFYEKVFEGWEKSVTESEAMIASMH